MMFIGAIFALIFSRIDLSLLLAQVQELRISYLLAGFGTILIAILIVSVRWKILLDVVAPGINLLPLVIFNLVGIFYSQFLPGNVTGDLVKGYYLARTDRDKVSVFSSVVVDRFIGISINGLIGVIALIGNATILNVLHVNANIPRFLVIATIVGIIALYFLFSFFGRWKHRFPRVVTPFYDAFQIYLKHPVSLAKAGLANLLYFLIWGLGFWALALSVGLTQIDFPTIILILAAVNFAQTIPVSINGWGIREGALILLLSAYGVPEEKALLLSLLVAATGLVVAVIGGMFVLSDYRHIRQHSEIAEGEHS